MFREKRWFKGISHFKGDKTIGESSIPGDALLSTAKNKNKELMEYFVPVWFSWMLHT
jgi:hypothetical protein